jgi:hypothetical protein
MFKNLLLKTWLGKFGRDLYNSFTNKPGGLSARKLTAFHCILMASYATYKHTTDANVTTVQAIWIAGGFLCLGIITLEQLTKFKNGSKEDNGSGTAPQE